MGLGKARLALNSTGVPTGREGEGTAIEFNDVARVNLLPLPARNERGEGWGEGKIEQKSPSSPRPSPPAAGGEGEIFALSANGSQPAKSPVGAASSASMPLLRSFGFLPFAIYKDAAPMGLGKAPLALNSTAVPIRGKGWGGAAIELSGAARVNLLPLPARNERGEGWGEGKIEQKSPSSPRPSPPAAGGEGELFALSANGSQPAKSPVGAASSTWMPLLRSFGFLPFAIYKDAAPMGLGKALLTLS
jgi:hypothetical protein